MRKSVTNKQAALKYEQNQIHRQHKRVAGWLLVPLFASVFLLVLSISNWQVTRQLQAADAQIAADKEASLKYIAIAKINAAKKAEADAIAKTKAEMAARQESERALAEATQTEPPTTINCGVKNPDSITVIINKKHCFNPVAWAPADLTDVAGYVMRAEAATQMTAMMNAAQAAGNSFGLSSTYRSYTDQQIVYNNWIKVNGSASAADTVSARPGYSEHQTGLAADLQTPGCALECFANTAAFTWLTDNAADYGFINRYPSGLSLITGYAPEAWHWRYIGVNVAKDMKAKGIQTMEQYFNITGGTY